MAIKKKVPANKKTAAPKKKVAPRKKSSKSQTMAPQEDMESKSIHSNEADFQEEDNQLIPPPVHSSSNQSSIESRDADSNNSMLKYLILAALILVGVIAYSLMSKKGSPTPVKQSGSEESTTQKNVESTIEPSSKKDTEPQPVSGNSQVPANREEAPSVQNDKQANLKGFALSQMVDGKNHSEAVEHCKSIGLRLPRADEMKKIKPASIPKELKTAVVWVADVSGGRNLRYVFETNKNQFTDSKTKLQVLCKE